MRKTWALVAGLAVASGIAAAPAAAIAARRTVTLTVLATTDTHGNVFNWDYFRNQPYSDKSGTAYGLARAGSIINQIRAERGAESVIVVDNGDTLQGTPLAYYYAKMEPITKTGQTHPMAAAFNAVGYDATNIGNHEFNYGPDLLTTYDRQLKAPILSANVLDAKTGKPVFQPYTIVTRHVKGAKPIKVGILGLTTPGSMIWDKANLEGKVIIQDMTAAAQRWVPKVRAAGADVVVVMSHAGIGQSSYDTTALGAENPSDKIAEQVPGIDAIVMGHTHQDVPQKFITNQQTGKQVLLTQPRYWASSVSDMTFELIKVKGQWTVASAKSVARYSKNATDDPAVTAAVEAMHDKAVAYVNQVVATSTEEMPAATSRWEDTAIIDFIQMVQTQTVEAGLKGTQYENLPVLSIAAPFSRTATFPKGEVTVRDIAGLYIYDNTLQAVVMTADQVKQYLEYSAKYFGTVPAGGTFDPDTHTSVVYNGQQVWDYNYDIISGLNYTIDLSQPVGSRITSLTHAGGTPVAGEEKFVVAVNNYRSSGGGNFPHIATAPVVYDQNQEIRQLLIDWASAHGTIDPADFSVKNWELTVAGQPAQG
ncbi:5'-nucleotidase C-terminal domain-containing protein [Aestuariimicrobium sp. p3-SID1156]|uniref:bifunctional metallophosphatase/5'-nucleotidase n=1 Tax=Aestuariimicrobium sp. p3-SID1156 TaxID=2916038 RepID=UPI00223B44CC|nr:5'-nucleotidase C-terminal domain-containing protein [Aestuariimicrobium sp. p3-SID1156]MCT1460112.1 5'-nucleotidase C-terminal domain-containing protein [Aestuariimicrobium sp. p3-SID1156]